MFGRDLIFLGGLNPSVTLEPRSSLEVLCACRSRGFWLVGPGLLEAAFESRVEVGALLLEVAVDDLDEDLEEEDVAMTLATNKNRKETKKVLAQREQCRSWGTLLPQRSAP